MVSPNLSDSHFQKVIAGNILTIACDAKVTKAIALLQTHVGSPVCVLGDQHQLVGIFSDRDLVRLWGQDITELAISEVILPIPCILKESEFIDIQVPLRLLQSHDIEHLPLVSDRGELLGIITQSSILNTLNPAEVSIEEPVKSQIAAIQSQLDLEQLLAGISIRIRQSLDLESILEATVHGIRYLLKCDRTVVYQFQPDHTGIFAAEAVTSNWIPLLQNHGFAGHEFKDFFGSDTQKAFLQGQIVIINDIYKAGLSESHVQLLEQFEVKASLVLPILIDQKELTYSPQSSNCHEATDKCLWGFLIADQCSAPRYWHSTDLEILDRLEEHIAIAIQQALIQEKNKTEIVKIQQIEETLRQSENRTQAILAAIPDLMYRIDREGTYLGRFSSNYVSDLLPLDLDPVGKNLLDFVSPELAKYKLQLIEQALVTREVQTYEQQNLIGGELQYEEVKITKVDDNEVLVIIRNISDRKQNEEVLRQSEERFRSVFDTAAVGMSLASPEGKHLLVNPTLCQMLGYSEEELLSLSFQEITHPADLEVDLIYARQLLNGEINSFHLEKRYIHKNGEIIWTLLSVSIVRDPQQQPLYDIALIQNISDRKLTEISLKATKESLRQLNQELELRVEQRTADLKESQKRYQVLFNSKSDSVFIHEVNENDSPDKFVEVNDAACKRLGYTRQELLQMSPCDLVPKTTQHDQNIIDAVNSHGQVIFETIHIAKDGSQFPVEITINKFESAGKPTILAFARDISDRKLAESALIESQKRYQVLFNSKSDAAFIHGFTEKGHPGQFLEVNDAACQSLGYTREELLQMNPKAIAPVPSKETVNHINSHPNPVFETIHFTKDGSQFPVEVTINKFESAGKPVVLAFARNISDRKTTEQVFLNNQQYFAAMFNQNAVGISHVAPDGRWLKVNQKFCDILGYRESELLEEHFQGITHPEDLTIQMDYIDQMLTGKRSSFEMEKRYIHKQGHKVWATLSSALISKGDGSPDYLIGVISDISDRKLAEEQLRQTNQKLTITNAELERATRLKGEFLANMSHELRTPLNAILGMSEGLKEGVFGEINQRQDSAISLLENSARHLLELINDILDLSKIEAGKLELKIEPVSVKHLCNSSIDMMIYQAGQKNLHLHLDIQPDLSEMMADELKLRQILLNLLSNAVKFTPTQGEITLKVKLGNPEFDLEGVCLIPTPEFPDYICFSVIDTGIGISAENIGNLFQPFMQIDSSLNRQFSGTGLGLALVQQIANLHGGCVTVSSEVNSGSCFSVFLPHSKERSPATNVKSPIHANLPRKSQAKVLLAEGNRVNIETFSNYLESRGYGILRAETGQKAVEIALIQIPDLIVIDTEIPEMNGLEFIRQIHAHSQLIGIPIIAISPPSKSSDRDTYLNAGVNEYLCRPVKLKQLATTIQNLLNTA